MIRAQIPTFRKFLIGLCLAASLLLTACELDLKGGSAQQATGGNGAGLSDYQETPSP